MAELKRDIGVVGATFIALNGVIAAGIFAMPQALAEKAGAASPYLILLFGVGMVFVALVFGELAGRFDVAGGPVVYADAAFGRFAGFQMGWLYYLSRVASSAANANLLLTYAATFVPGIDQGMLRLSALATILLLFVAINIAGVKSAVRTLNVVTLFKLAPLAVLTIWGLSAFFTALPAPQAPQNPDAFGGLALLLLYAFVGFELATVTAGETGNAKQTIPRALVATIIGAALFYFLIQLAYVAVMQGGTPEGAPLAAMAEKLGGPTGAVLIAIAAIVSVSGNLFASTLAAPRLTYAMAEEGVLPAWFGKLHSRFATPAHSIAFMGLITGALAMSGAFVWLAVMTALTRMVIYLTCTAALLKLRREAPQRGQSGLLGWLIPLGAAALCAWAGAQAEPRSWLVLAAFAGAGALLYAFGRWRSRTASPIYGAKNLPTEDA